MNTTDIVSQIAGITFDALAASRLVQIEVSARHVHLSQHDVERLFGAGYTLTPKRPLSQPGQFLCEERITLKTPKGTFANVAVLGPGRSDTQIELSISDAFVLGLKPPIRLSGDVVDSPGVTLVNCGTEIQTPSGVIIAKRHIHVTPDIAEKAGLTHNSIVAVKALTDRPVVFEDVVVRVSERFRFRMHIDFDEANAAAVSGFTLGQIL